MEKFLLFPPPARKTRISVKLCTHESYIQTHICRKSPWRGLSIGAIRIGITFHYSNGKIFLFPEEKNFSIALVEIFGSSDRTNGKPIWRAFSQYMGLYVPLVCCEFCARLNIEYFLERRSISFKKVFPTIEERYDISVDSRSILPTKAVLSLKGLVIRARSVGTGGRSQSRCQISEISFSIPLMEKAQEKLPGGLMDVSVVSVKKSTL